MDEFHELALLNINNYLSNKNDLKGNFSEVLKTVDEIAVFSAKKNSSVEDLIGQINDLISTRNTRCEGVALLKHVIEQCSSQIFTSNALSWSKMLLQVISTHNTARTQRLVCSVFETIFDFSSKIPALSQEIGSAIIPVLVTSLLDAQQEWLLNAFLLIASCMKNFPGPCGPLKSKIEASVVKHIGSSSPCQKGAQRCYSLLAGTGGGGSHGVKHTEAWTSYTSKLIATLHHVLNDLYNDLETETYDKQADGFIFDSVQPQDARYHLVLKQRFLGITGTLIKMLSTKFSAIVNFPLEDLIELICRVVAVTPRTVMVRPTQERVAVAMVLPFIHSAAFKLLDVIVQVCGSLLLSYTDTINLVFTQSLNWSSVATETSQTTCSKAFTELRVCVYSTLTTWLSVLGVSADVETVASDIVKHCVCDARPVEDDAQSKSKLSKRVAEVKPGKKKKHGGVSSWASRETGQFSDEKKEVVLANEKLCLSAIQVLRHLLSSSGPLLDAEIFKTIQNFTMAVLLKVTQQRERACPDPYSSPACRKALYSLLSSCVTSPPSSLGAPSQVAVGLLSSGTQDKNISVANLCRESLAMCSYLIHPCGPSLTEPASSAPLNSMSTAESGVAETVTAHRAVVNEPSPERQLASAKPKDQQMSDSRLSVDPIIIGSASFGANETELEIASDSDDEDDDDDDDDDDDEEEDEDDEVIEINGSEIEEVDISDEVEVTSVIPPTDTFSHAPVGNNNDQQPHPSQQASTSIDQPNEANKDDAPIITSIEEVKDVTSETHGEKRHLDSSNQDEPVKKKTCEGETPLSDMLATFVDADADSD